MTYASKVDSWIGIVLVLVPAGLLLEAVLLPPLVGGLVAASVAVVYALVVFPVNYELGRDALTARSGILRTSIPCQEMRDVSGPVTATVHVRASHNVRATSSSTLVSVPPTKKIVFGGLPQ